MSQDLDALQRWASVVRLEVYESARRATEVDPGLILADERLRLIDEWQLFPRVWDHVRRAVDSSCRPPRLLTMTAAAPISPPEALALRYAERSIRTVVRVNPLSIASEILNAAAAAQRVDVMVEAGSSSWP